MGNPLSPLSSDLLTQLPLDPIDSLIVLGRLLSERGLTNQVVLIGGQALYLWSLRYPTRLPPLEVPYLTSKDIDYIRSVGTSIEVLAGIWGAQDHKKAHMDEHTPHEALVYFLDVENKPVVVDIMETILGVEKQDVLEKADFLPVEGISISLMNPIHCLQSRIANAFGRGLSEEKFAREVVRVKGAIDICRGWLFEALDEGFRNGQLRSPIRAVNTLVGYCRTASARRVARTVAINIADALPLHHPIWTSSDSLTHYETLTLRPTHAKLQGLIGQRQVPKATVPGQAKFQD